MAPVRTSAPRATGVLTKPEDEDKRSLVSIDLDGSDRRAHLLSERPPSSRCRHRSGYFREGFAAYIAPVPTGKRIDIG
jgi:hypothetical protein